MALEEQDTDDGKYILVMDVCVCFIGCWSSFPHKLEHFHKTMSQISSGRNASFYFPYWYGIANLYFGLYLYNLYLYR